MWLFKEMAEGVRLSLGDIVIQMTLPGSQMNFPQRILEFDFLPAG